MVIGLVMIYSASSISAMNEFGDSAYYLKHQLIFILVGSILCVITVRIPYKVWISNIAWGLWVIELTFLVITAALGVIGLGAQRWVSLPGLGTVQPSELAKVVVILVLALLIVRYHEGAISLRRFAGLSILAVAAPCLLIIAQPDLGTTIIVAAAAFFALWFGEVDIKPLLAVIVVIIVVGVVFIFTSPYRTQRFMTVLDPWADPLGDGYQTINSLYAFGSGGLFGVGLGNSRQKYSYLPEAHTDFIFSIIGEELGLIGAAFVILLFVVFILCGILVSRNVPTLSGRIIAGASTCTIGLQAAINIACTLGCFPITGKPLPFVSSGGSSLIATLLLVGLILSVSFGSTEADRYEAARADLRVIDGGEKRPRTEVREKKRAAMTPTETTEKRPLFAGLFDRRSDSGEDAAARKMMSEERPGKTVAANKPTRAIPKDEPSKAVKKKAAAKTGSPGKTAKVKRKDSGAAPKPATSSSSRGRAADRQRSQSEPAPRDSTPISHYSTHRHRASTIELADSKRRGRDDR